MNRYFKNRARTVALLAVIFLKDNAGSLSDYMSDDDRLLCDEFVDLYKVEGENEYKLWQVIRQMEASEKFSSLAEIHPAWILEKLCNESPRVIGIILRSLPSKHVRYIINNLPPMLRAQIPDMVESFVVAAPVLEVIRRRFESHFLPMPVSRVIDSFGFENLYYLKGAEIDELVREIGLGELAIALSSMQGKALHVVYNRLDLKDAKRLQRKVRELGSVSPELFRQACYTVLEVEGKHVGPDSMLIRIGLAALASAVEEDYENSINLLQQKLEPGNGYLLKRFIDERRMRANHQVALERRDLILKIVASLSDEGRINASWNRFLNSAKEPISLKAPVVSRVSEEETATLEQLA